MFKRVIHYIVYGSFLAQIAVLVSNAIASLLQPSFYDSIILIKQLPFLPDLKLHRYESVTYTVHVCKLRSFCVKILVCKIFVLKFLE